MVRTSFWDVGPVLYEQFLLCSDLLAGGHISEYGDAT